MDPLATVLLSNPELIIQPAKLGWNTVKKFFDDCDAKDSIHYGDAYFDYLENTVHSISQIKTLIYRHVPKFLYLFYEYPNIQYKDQAISTFNAQDILDLNNKLLVTGIGGIGKSLLLKHFFLNIAQYGCYIPVLIELRKFNQMDSKEISLYDAIYQNLSNNGFKLEDKYYKYSLEAGGYVILLDGFDEVNRDKAQKVFDQIQNFSQRYNKNHFIVSSRPSDRFVGWNDFHGITLCNLTKTQALNLIQKIDFDEAIKKPFSDALDSKLFDTYESFASNPLLLTIMLLTFSNHAALPDNPNDFYEQAFSTLFNGHDATKDYFVRDIRSHLSYENFKTIFAYICFKSFFKDDFEFSDVSLRHYIELAKIKYPGLSFTAEEFQEDLTLSVCMLIKDGLTYHFIHRSFQEYFAAWYTCKLTDHEQIKLLTAYLSETAHLSNINSTDKYFEILFDLQPDKVNKILLCPGIKKLKALYQNEGFSIHLLSSLFYGFFLEKIYLYRNNTWLPFRVLSFCSLDRYLCNILNLTCNFNYGSCLLYVIDDPEEIECIHKLFKAKNSSNHSNQSLWSFKEALSIVSSDELLNCLDWCDSRFQQCFEIYDRYNQDPISNKNTVSSIIDEL
ncbi:NACHT domain-containing protein [Faecalibacterium sp. An122]|uniref:NACHT domain-containing protein n=1 Tax=Faecalibacterium sp. An122 TaxID=1965551 RepID=UPI000B57AC6B|nr:NACHT domain-containing protein [Faecalibacterium sp. An122]OUQ35664.1 hypothetical protein B5E67_11760 [Faecalibacterium sp. An122]